MGRHVAGAAGAGGGDPAQRAVRVGDHRDDDRRPEHAGEDDDGRGQAADEAPGGGRGHDRRGADEGCREHAARDL